MFRRLTATVTLLVFLSASAFAESPSLIVRGGVFLPNGTSSGGAKQGLSDFDSGSSVTGGVVIPVAPYADLELTGGYYTAKRSVSIPGSSNRTIVTGIPLMAVVKIAHDIDPFRIFAGAGGGYLIASVEATNMVGTATAHGNALAYLLTAGGSCPLTDRLSLGADVTWFRAEPTIDLTAISARKSTWDLGGTTLSITLGWSFH